MESNSAQVLVTNGIASYGDAMIVILLSIVVVIIGFVVLRRGLAMLRIIDPNSGRSEYD